MKIAWFSGGATSAVACKFALETDPDTVIWYIETGSHHPDHARFIKDCETWYGKPIHRSQHDKYQSVSDVIRKTRWINGVRGAACTRLLKKDVRKQIESQHTVTHYVWGFEHSPREMGRANRMGVSEPGFIHEFPLIDRQIDKRGALQILQDAGIELPAMYRLGYHNSNCIGCVKGGMAYWNKIRVDFPDIFQEMAVLEREIGRSCLKGVFLDELDPERGRDQPPLVHNCGAVGEGCVIENS
jgi:3'-phosphoadenosine 5'-phosphosulfate sulfotransferase (PAPS reductase)/FAD synthetase